jgi:hypothetical protein
VARAEPRMVVSYTHTHRDDAARAAVLFHVALCRIAHECMEGLGTKY